MIRLIDKLKARWEVDSIWQVLLILFIFAITGYSTLYIKDLLYGLIGFGIHTPFWEKAIVWLLVILPSYQLMFLGYGFLFGQFDFVWKFEKKSFGRIKNLFTYWKNEPVDL